MKKSVCLLLSLCLCAALCVPALAWPQNYEERWDYVSWVRDGSLDERNDPFQADKKITMLGWDYENEVPTSNEENYEYVAKDTSWTVKNTGTGNYYIWLNCSYCPRIENGSYSGEWGASLRENGHFVDEAMDDEEEGYKVKQLYPGESVTFSFDQFIDPYDGDKGNGEYVYSLRINMEFPEENDAWARLSKNFMFNEAEVQRMKAEIGGGQTPAVSSPAAPTVGGGAAITRANVGTLTEITVPVAYSGDTAQTVTFAVPFYDGNGKFIGMGMKTETVTSSTQSVSVPVGGLSGSESMKVMVLGDTFHLLSPVGNYNIPA